MTDRAPRGPLLLRGVAVLLAVLAHAGLLAAAFWPRERPKPPPVEAVAVVLSGAAGTADEGTGAPPAPMAPAMEAVAAQPAPEPAAPTAPPSPEQPPAPEPALAEAMPPEPLPSAPAEIALPLPAPAPPPMPATAPAATVAPAPPRLPPSSPPQPAAPGPVRLGAGVALDIAPGTESRAARPRDVACSDATEYPPELRQAGIGGDVVLRLRLTDKGRVIEAKVAESSGHPQLDEAVQRSVRRCRFDPALRDGVPVWSNLTWRVTFRPY